jgi:Spy/CpxP family protein refolding chaperone
MNVKTLLFTALILIMSTTVYAYRGGGCPYGNHYQGFMSGLTTEQQEKVTAVTDKHHEQLFALHKELQAKHEAMDALFAATPTDKAAIQALVKEINALHAKKFELNTEYRLELQEVAGKPLPFKYGQGRGPGYGQGRGHGHGQGCCPGHGKGWGSGYGQGQDYGSGQGQGPGSGQGRGLQKMNKPAPDCPRVAPKS